MAWRQIISSKSRFLSTPSNLPSDFARFSSKSNPYQVKVGIPEFLKGVGKGVETHVEKLETEIGDFQKLLVTRTLKLKKLGLPCKHTNHKMKAHLGIHCLLLTTLCQRTIAPFSRIASQAQALRKLILKFAHKYRLGLWRPRAEPVKA